MFCGIFTDSLEDKVIKAIKSDEYNFTKRNQKLRSYLEDKDSLLKIVQKIKNFLTKKNMHSRIFFINILNILTDVVDKVPNTDVGDKVLKIFEMILNVYPTKRDTEFLLAFSKILYGFLNKFISTTIKGDFTNMLNFSCAFIFEEFNKENVDIISHCINCLALIVTRSYPPQTELIKKNYDTIIKALITARFYSYSPTFEFGKKLGQQDDKSNQALGAIILKNLCPESNIIVKALTNSNFILNSIFIEQTLQEVLPSMGSNSKVGLLNSLIKETLVSLNNKNPLSALEILRHSTRILSEMPSSHKDIISYEISSIYADIYLTTNRIVEKGDLNTSSLCNYKQILTEVRSLFNTVCEKGRIIPKNALEIFYQKFNSSNYYSNETENLTWLLDFCKITIGFINIDKTSEFIDEHFFTTINLIGKQKSFPPDIFLEILKYILIIVDKFKIIKNNLGTDSIAPLKVGQIKSEDLQNLQSFISNPHEINFQQNVSFLNDLMFLELNSNDHYEIIYKIYLSFVIFCGTNHDYIKKLIYLLTENQSIINSSSDLGKNQKQVCLNVLLKTTLTCSTILNNEDLIAYIEGIVIKNSSIDINLPSNDDEAKSWIYANSEEISKYLGDTKIPSFAKKQNEFYETLSIRSAVDFKNKGSTPFLSTKIPSTNEKIFQTNSFEDNNLDLLKSDSEEVEENLNDLKNKPNMTYSENLNKFYGINKLNHQVKTDDDIESFMNGMDEI